MAMVSVVLPVVLTVVVIVVLLTRDGTAGGLSVPDSGGLWRTARRRSLAFRWLGIAVGLAAAVALSEVDALGRGLLLAAPVFALVVRRSRDYLPLRLTRSVTTAFVTLVVVLIATTWAGSADDLGRAGRALTASCPTGSSSHGPWPGSFYSLPLAAVLVIGAALTTITLRVVTSRPRFGGTTDLQAADEALRRRAGEAVTAAFGLLVAVPLLGIAATAAMGLLGVNCAPTWWAVAGWGLVGVAVLTFGLLCWCLAALVAPASERTTSEPALR